jgi:fumarate hydratase class II
MRKKQSFIRKYTVPFLIGGVTIGSGLAGKYKYDKYMYDKISKKIHIEFNEKEIEKEIEKYKNLIKVEEKFLLSIIELKKHKDDVFLNEIFP